MTLERDEIQMTLELNEAILPSLRSSVRSFYLQESADESAVSNDLMCGKVMLR